MHTDLNINFKDIDCYQKLLNDTFCLSVKIKSETKILYTALIPNSSEPTEEILQQMSSDSQNLYDNLYKLMYNFESSPYECSADHVLGHYIKAYYLAEAGVDLVKNMTLLYSLVPDDYTSQVLLLRAQMELISFILRYLENAVREYK